jgi:HK97 family phage portal protein
VGVGSRIREAFRSAFRSSVAEASQPAPSLEPPKPEQVRRAGFEYGIPFGGAAVSQQVANSQERVQILTQLHQAYLTCPWVSAPIDLIARTITAGGVQIVTDDEVADGEEPFEPDELTRLRRLLRFTNPHEDLVQLLRNVCTDLMLFGDAFIEVVFLLGEPVALYMLDATTMTVICDAHGEVTGYHQQTDTGKQAEFSLTEVIHISLDAPRGGIYGVSPAQKAMLPITAWLFCEATIKECFRRGDPESMHVDLAGYTETEAQTWLEKYKVFNLGPKAVGTPVVTRNGSQVKSLNPRKVTDYLDTSRQLRDEIIATFGVPPAKLGIIETGNLGGGSGESQNKTLRINTVIPLQSLVLEKLNYHLLQVGFKITGWHLEFDEIDYRDSDVVEKIRDMRIRNGLYVLNRGRDEINEPPVEGGDEAVIIERENITRWRDVEAASQAGIASKLKGTALEPGQPKPGEAVAVEKPEPAPTPPQLAAFTGEQPNPDAPGQKLDGAGKTPPPAEPFPSKDRPGGPDDATQGKAPRENRYDRDFRRLSESWQHAYRARRKMALAGLPTFDEQTPEPKPQDSLPVDPYWDAGQHTHNDRPDYTPQDLGVPNLERVIVDPRDVHVDHAYQRPRQEVLVRHYADEPRQRLAERVGLLAQRPDGTLWVIDGQHHSAAAIDVGITALTYQQFASSGPVMEARIYAALRLWHGRHHEDERSKATKPGPKTRVPGMPQDHTVAVGR